MLLPVSGSRGPVLALVVGFAAALLVFGGRAVPWLKVHAIALLAGGAAYHLVPGVARSSLLGSALERGGANNGRFSFWARAAQLIEDAPWLGVGPGNFAHYRLPGIYSPAHPHNTLLQVAAEWGLPAAALASALVLWGLYVWARARRAGGADDGSPQVAVAITASLAAGVAHSFIDGIAVMPLSQTFGALVVGWALSVHARGSPAPAQRRETAGLRWGCRALALLALVTLASTLRLPLRPLAHNEAPAPRFWLRGAVP
jgi:O-antigen ligase